MADQCIVCLEDLDVADSIAVDDLRDAGGTSIVEHTTTHPATSPTKSESVVIALIKPCNHVLHDECLKLWSQKANSCPICRVLYNQIEVLDKVGGTVLYEYSVEDKKQVAEYDPSDFLDDASNDQEDDTPCVVCDGTDNEDVLLLCDGCETPYHTYCLGLDGVPRGNWFCPECASQGAYDQAEELAGTGQGRDRPAHASSRTLHTQRQIRQRMRNDAWLGSWNRVSSRIHELAGVDLDFSDDEGDMDRYRSIQGRAARADREFREWRSRLRIADRQGAAEEFRRAVPAALQEILPEISAEESKAWGAFDKAKELEAPGPAASSSATRKRKSRSVTASPIEPPTEPERKLKRPRTRRVIEKPESASASPPVAGPSRLPPTITSPPPNPPSSINGVGEPSFLSSLLKEVEMAPSDDDASKPVFSTTTNGGLNNVTSPALDFSSPATSPSPNSSAYHTPRALSTTPPPQPAKRLGSPLSLTSRIEPAYLSYRYSPNRPPSDENSTTLELRHPRPTRRHPVHLPRSGEISPVRATMSASSKEGISKIVKSALNPHWKNAEITKEQYADINREVSRKLYEIIAEQTLDDEKQKTEWEKLATTEVASAVKSLAAVAS